MLAVDESCDNNKREDNEHQKVREGRGEGKGNTPFEFAWCGNFHLCEISDDPTEHFICAARHFLLQLCILGQFALHVLDVQCEIYFVGLCELKHEMRIAGVALANGRVDAQLCIGNRASVSLLVTAGIRTYNKAHMSIIGFGEFE